MASCVCKAGDNKEIAMNERRRTTKRDAALAEIARDVLGIETLESRKSDDLDFHDLAVWSIEKALQAAYEAGQANANVYRATATEVRDNSTVTSWTLAATDTDSARERAREQAARRGFCSDIFVRVERIKA